MFGKCDLLNLSRYLVRHSGLVLCKGEILRALIKLPGSFMFTCLCLALMLVALMLTLLDV